MTDIVNYAIPYGPFGRLANTLLVKKQVQKVFAYREKAIVDLFGRYNSV